jgi:peptidoglycan/LPS O-acetylase OafA/YrhL
MPAKTDAPAYESHRMSTAPARKFSTGTSVLLDVLRLASAVVIAGVHLTQSSFSIGWPSLTDQGKPALVMLFLLSGLVIRYVTVMRRGTMTDFWVDRISRVYSVVLPALAFTIVASYLAMRINPAYYMANWGANNSSPLLRIGMNLIFMAQSWNLTLDPFANLPFWTLSYEVFYYVFYAVGFYLAGIRRAFWLVIAAVLAGQHILLLLPLWLIGCLAHDVYQRARNPQISLRKLNLIFLAVGAGGAVLVPAMFRLLIYLKSFLTRFFWAHHHAPINLHWAYDYYVEGLPTVFVLLWMMLVFERLKLAEKATWVRWVRLLSEATFPLYLLHFPLYVLIVAIFPNERANAWFKLGMLVVCVAFSALLAKPTVHFKNYLRDLLRMYVFHTRLLPAATRLQTAK